MSIKVVSYEGELTLLVSAGSRLTEETRWPERMDRVRFDNTFIEVVERLRLYPPSQRSPVENQPPTWAEFARVLFNMLYE